MQGCTWPVTRCADPRPSGQARDRSTCVPTGRRCRPCRKSAVRAPEPTPIEPQPRGQEGFSVAEPPDEEGAVTPDPPWSRLERMCLSDVSVDEFLSSVTEVARHVVPGVRAASVTMLGPQGPETPAYSGSLAVELDHVQYRL